MYRFMEATRKKYRFPFKGQIATEDLWDLSVVDLDKVFKALCKQKREETTEESLLAPINTNSDLDNKIEIVRMIVMTKQNEAAARQKNKETADRKQQILAILADKEQQSLKDKSKEELIAMLDSLK